MEGAGIVQAGVGAGAAAGGILKPDLLSPISWLFCIGGAPARLCVLGSSGPSVWTRSICSSNKTAGQSYAWLRAGDRGCCGLLS